MTVIRTLESSDLDRVWAINQANVPEVGAVERDRCAELAELSSLALVVESPVGDDDAHDVGDGAVDRGEHPVVGFCLVIAPGADYHSVNYRWFMERTPEAWYLDRVAFDAAFVGRGLGTRLYAEVETRLRAMEPPVTTLTLEVNVDPPNETSLGFHARRGFVELGRQVYGDDIEVSLLAKDL